MQSQSNEHLNPFLGAKTYEEENKEIFFGRDKENFELFQLVKLNLLTLLYGKSGLGKSSLLKAGLFPKLRESNHLPIFIKPNYANADEDYIQHIYNEINKCAKAFNKSQDDLTSDSGTLWEILHKNLFQIGTENKTPVLVFDQFEEIFTLGTEKYTNSFRENIEHLIDFLSQVIENSIPAKRDEFLKGNKSLEIDENERETLFNSYSRTKVPVKIIFSFREEYLPYFRALSSVIPAIDYSNSYFRLDFLTYETSREVINNAGQDKFEEKAVEKMLLLLSNSWKDGESNTQPSKNSSSLIIESFMLSIYANFIYGKLIKSNSQTQIVTESFVDKKEFDSLLEKLFQEATIILKFSDKKWLYPKLLSEGGYRVPVYSKDVKLKDGLTIKVDKLVDKKILRRAHYNNDECIEIIHDKFIPVIKRENRRIKRRKKVLVGTSIFVVFLLLISLTIGYFGVKKDLNLSEEKEARIAQLQQQSNAVALRLKVDSIKQASIINQTKSDLQKQILTAEQKDGELTRISQEKKRLDANFTNATSELEKTKIQLQLAENEIRAQSQKTTITVTEYSRQVLGLNTEITNLKTLLSVREETIMKLEASQNLTKKNYEVSLLALGNEIQNLRGVQNIKSSTLILTDSIYVFAIDANVRKTPMVAPDNIATRRKAGEEIIVKRVIESVAVDGNNRWFVDDNGNYIWSGSLLPKK